MVLYKSLSTCVGAKTVVLAIVPQFSDANVPSSLAEDLPTMLSELYNKDRNPFLGASLDGIVERKCCGQKTCEMKVRNI